MRVVEAVRPEISVYWVPGCSMCLNTKEFLEAQGIAFESINCLDRDDAMEELATAGLRGLPVVRKGERFSYVQSLDAVAEFLEISRGGRRRLTQDEFLDRWEQVLDHAQAIISGFSEELLNRPVTVTRPRLIKVLASHVFQIPEVFVRIIEEGLVETEDLQNEARPEIVTRDDLLSYIEATMATFRDWRKRGGAAAIPEQILTYYGRHPSYQVLERAVWHSTQHARQLDAVAAGVGWEPRIPPEMYLDLPMPKRLWE